MSGPSATTFEKRTAEAKRILAKYPGRIPVLAFLGIGSDQKVICEKAERSDLPDIEKKKFLVPVSMLCGQFKYIIHKHINQSSAATNQLSADQTIYLFVKNKEPPAGSLMSEVYDSNKADDGFLYVTYAAENTLGC